MYQDDLSNESIVLKLLNIGIFRIGDFVLKSGDKSPFYFDLRLIPSYPDLFSSVVELYCNLTKQIGNEVRGIAGLISAGIPFATGISLKLNLPLLQIRKQEKTYGTKKLIEGKVVDGSKIAIIDDLISTGASKIPAIDALREGGYQVEDIIVFIDRRKDTMIGPIHGCKVHAVFTLNNIVGIVRNLIEKGDLTKDSLDFSKIQEWNKS